MAKIKQSLLKNITIKIALNFRETLEIQRGKVLKLVLY